MARPALDGLVLCGGESRRYGSDKALAEVAGKAMIDHVIDALRPHCPRIILLAGQRPQRFQSRLGDGVELFFDRGLGPAEALRTWLSGHRKRHLVVAVDMPFLTAADLGAFIAASEGCSVLGDLCATLPCIIDERFLLSEEPSLAASLRSVQARRIGAEELAIDAARLANLNRPEMAVWKSD